MALCGRGGSAGYGQRAITAGRRLRSQEQKCGNGFAGSDVYKRQIYHRSILRLLFDTIDELLKEHPDQFTWTGLDTRQGKRAYPVSVQICHAANLFIELFHMLKLSEVPIPKEQGTVSYNKLLLISRIIYFMKLTRTKSYLDDENALKAILRDYSNVPIMSFV